MKRANDSRRLARLAKIAAIPDERIDTSDIPEAPVENWALARRGQLYRPIKQAVTIRLDADIVAWAKERAESGRYQTEINNMLRDYIGTTLRAEARLRIDRPDLFEKKPGLPSPTDVKIIKKTLREDRERRIYEGLKKSSNR